MDSRIGIQFTFPEGSRMVRRRHLFDSVIEELHQSGLAGDHKIHLPAPATQMVNPDEIWITIISYPADVVPLQILLSAVLTTNRTLEKMGLAHRYHAVGEGVYEAKGGDRDE